MSSARALVSCAVMLGSIACGGSRFQSDDGSGGSSGAMGGTGKGGGASSGGASSGGASSGGASSGGASSGGASSGGTLGVSGGSSTGGSGAEPGAGGGPSGGAGNEGGSMSGTGGFNVAGTGGIGGGMTVSCATDPNCFNCCRETIGNGAFSGLVYECGCSAACYDVCFGFCEQGTVLDESCEFCIVSEFQNATPSQLCADDREQCNGNLECTKYFNCLSSCEP